jgi:hypothetical protein
MALGCTPYFSCALTLVLQNNIPILNEPDLQSVGFDNIPDAFPYEKPS